MNKLKYLLFLSIIFIAPSVFAQDFTVSNSNITSPNSGGTGKYTGTEIYNTGTANVYNMNTRYSGRLSRIVFNLSPGGYAETTSNFDLGKTYTLTLNMATDDWRNNFGSVSVKCNGSSGVELSNGRVNYISYRKINFSFSTGSNTCGFVYVDLKSSNIVSTAFTGVSNWNLSSMVITDPTYCSGSECYSPPSGGSSGSTNQDIINANNQNTQDIITNDDKNTNNIINNDTNNTNNIIDNANQNTQDIINNQKELLGNCYKNFSNVNTLSVPFTSGNSGKLLLDSISNNNEKFYFSFSSNYTTSRILIMPYNSSGNLITTSPFTSSVNFTYNSFYGGYYYDGGSNTSLNITFNNTVSYFVVGFVALNNPTHIYSNIIISNSNMPFIDAGSTKCISKLDDTNNSINNVNDSINNPNVDSNTGQGFFDNFTSQDFGLSQIITIPLNTIQSLTSKSCVPLQVPIPFTNSNINLPCMTEIYENKFPTIYNLWKIVSFGIVAYFIAIDIFHIVKGFKDPESDKVEVLDL